MRNALLAAIAAVTFATASIGTGYAQAQTTTPAGKSPTIKTRLDHFSGTKWVLVVSYIPSEITSITCESWTMLGINSWKKQNEFTIPAGPAVAVMDANGFDGYCKDADAIKAHTDDGDYTGVLDRGAGNWQASTKLTFIPQGNR
jgi:hypothetical protein